MQFFKKYKIPIGLFVLFEMIGILFTIIHKHVFYIMNFSYIGFFVALTVGLIMAGKRKARLLSEFAVGLYMLVFLGIINRENMQLEGFFFFALMGIFMAAVIHYAVAKIVGPFIFGRAWCGYACWTAMVLDLFPYKVPKNQPVKKLGLLRIVIFVLSLAYFVFIYFHYNMTRDIENIMYNMNNIMFISFIIGNIIYYVVGIIFIFIFKDNRAFCKYFCPITVFLKPCSYFSLLRVKVNTEKCISCNKCIKICPMNVDMLDNKFSRKNGTECIQCLECVHECPKKALSWRIGK
jgi:polyferredoxin